MPQHEAARPAQPSPPTLNEDRDPDHEVSSDLDRSRELARLVRFWRSRRKPSDYPGLVTGRTVHHMSQELMAQIIGSTTRWYAQLEKGVLGGYSPDFLDRSALALRLTAGERGVLYMLALGHEPPPDESPVVEADTSLRQLVRDIPHPAYVSDGAWDMLYTNQALADWFPFTQGTERNIMRWIFTYPEAKYQLTDIEQDWWRPMLAQMRVAHSQQPGNDRLSQIISEILDVNLEAQAMWEHPEVQVHPDGDVRRLRPASTNKVTTVEIMAMTPFRTQNARLIVLMPRPDSAYPKPSHPH
jgi:transcriptional regulator with XRE-family HTH domain